MAFLHMEKCRGCAGQDQEPKAGMEEHSAFRQDLIHIRGFDHVFDIADAGQIQFGIVAKSKGMI